MSKELNAILLAVRDIRKEKEELAREEDLLWKRFFEIADDTVGANMNFAYVNEKEELAIRREMHQASPKLNVEKLKVGLTENEWKSISSQVRIINQEKLEKALAKEEISRKVVDSSTEYSEPVAHKKFGKATRRDLEKD